MDEKTIKETLLKGERVTLECKKAQSNVPVNADLMLLADLQTKGIIVREGSRKEGKWVIKVNKRN